MIQFWENLVTDGQTDRQTDGREWFHRIYRIYLAKSILAKDNTYINLKWYKHQLWLSTVPKTYLKRYKVQMLDDV